jgi:16S rRNA (guanine(966)-N(2))-methyltransferase RsmD
LSRNNLKKIRPTSGKARGALFNILTSAGLVGVDFLDLFAGTGAVALEALRLGSPRALCVESDRAASDAIKTAFAEAGFDEAAAGCICADVRRVVPRLARDAENGVFGVVFADPPYNMGWGRTLPPLMAENWRLISPGGVFVFERSSREAAADIFIARDDRIYGETVISFYWN